MADIMSPEKRSRLMGRIRGRDTTPERYLRLLLQSSKIFPVLHDRSLPGRPDFVFPERNVIVFVDGDFWHGWRFSVWSHRLTPFWRDKISQNRQRDERNHRRLRRLGWSVMRIWEHQVEQDVLGCIRRIEEATGTRVDWEKVRAELGSLPPLKRRKRLPKP